MFWGLMIGVLCFLAGVPFFGCFAAFIVFGLIFRSPKG